MSLRRTSKLKLKSSALVSTVPSGSAKKLLVREESHVTSMLRLAEFQRNKDESPMLCHPRAVGSLAKSSWRTAAPTGRAAASQRRRPNAGSIGFMSVRWALLETDYFLLFHQRGARATAEKPSTSVLPLRTSMRMKRTMGSQTRRPLASTAQAMS